MIVSGSTTISSEVVTPLKPLVTVRHDNNTFSSFLFGPVGGAMLAGIIEISIFHPFDTISKRLQSHHKQVVFPYDWAMTKRNTIDVITKNIPTLEAGNSRVFHHIKHFYPGSLYAINYKILQRVVKFAGQPYVRDYLRNNHREAFLSTFGQRKGKGMLEATAGSVVGVLEVSLLPFDRMKVLSQTNKCCINGSMLSIIAREGPRCMYVGAGITAFRNLVGSFLLFGGTAFTKEYILGIDDYCNATVAQNMVASSVGAVLGVFCTSPIDVVKTRLQCRSFGAEKETGLYQFTHTIKTEGVHSLMKGIVPKLITSAPRLTLSYTLTQFFTGKLRSINPVVQKHATI